MSKSKRMQRRLGNILRRTYRSSIENLERFIVVKGNDMLASRVVNLVERVRHQNFSVCTHAGKLKFLNVRVRQIIIWFIPVVLYDLVLQVIS